MLNDVGQDDIDVMTKALLLRRLEEKGVQIRCNCELKVITPEGVTVSEGGPSHNIAADTIVMAVGATPKREEAEQYIVPGVETYIMGDCNEVGNALDAIATAYVTALGV